MRSSHISPREVPVHLFGRLDADTIVHSITDSLFAAKISLRRLDRNVPEQKLDLFEFSAGHVTEMV